jgi:hypothetical protein
MYLYTSMFYALMPTLKGSEMTSCCSHASSGATRRHDADRAKLPVAIIGGGPVGLAAAAHLLERGLEPVIFEAGSSVGTARRDWGHVHLFSPWRYNVDGACRALLNRHGWTPPNACSFPTAMISPATTSNRSLPPRKLPGACALPHG